MKIFFDTEFTGLTQNTSLISIGLISNELAFCGEITDYDENQVDDWINDNVIENLLMNEYQEGTLFEKQEDDITVTYCKGSKHFVSEQLRNWLTNNFTKIEWVSDVCHYDFVLLIDLVWGHALRMPYKTICSACHDINQDIANAYDVNEIEAFNMSREEILKDKDIIVLGQKHNSLYDAKVIKAIYENII